MKKIELCFLEIINSLSNIKKEKDNNESKFKSVFSWSKCRNFTGIDYMLEGYITLEERIYLYYFFSNKRSYIALTSEKDIQDDINKLQYNLVIYTEYLFKKYSIDIFINNLVNTN
jgi:hypothetical protein